MNLLPMRYFLAAARLGGISAAARELYITQQTLSAHMAALEKELGCTLFRRRPAFRLTDEGRVFRAYCEKMLSLDDAMHREFREMAAEPSGTLRIAISQTRSRILIPPAAVRWHSRFPRVSLRVLELSNDPLIRAVQEDRADIAVGLIPEDVPELTVTRLYEEELLLLIPDTPAYAHLGSGVPAPEELARCAFLTNSASDIVGRYGERFFTGLGIVPRIAAMSDMAETCMEMCAAGLGLYICPDLMYRALPLSGRPPRAVPLGIRYPISAAVRKGLTRSRLAEEFIGVLQEG